MEANQYLNDFYNHYDEDSRLLFQHGSVEFLTTMRYIEKYLKHGDKVLEIGAGTGRYSHALARRGHPVDAVELVAHNMRFSAKTPVPGKASPSHRAMLWICPPLRTTPTMSRFCSARFIICIRRTTSAGRCGRRSASQSRAALSLPLMSSPTAAFWTRASAAAISLLPNMCGTGCWTPGRLPPAPSQRICSNWCAKRMLMS